MTNQEYFHNRLLSNDPEELVEALDELKYYFLRLLNKQQVWYDLHRLTNNKDSYVREKTIHILKFNFLDLPDKQRAWNDLIKLISDED